jgi:hypothetical protein
MITVWVCPKGKAVSLSTTCAASHSFFDLGKPRFLTAAIDFLLVLEKFLHNWLHSSFSLCFSMLVIIGCERIKVKNLSALD